MTGWVALLIETSIVPLPYCSMDLSCLFTLVYTSVSYYASIVLPFNFVRAPKRLKPALTGSAVNRILQSPIFSHTNASSGFTPPWWKRYSHGLDQYCRGIWQQIWKSEKPWYYDKWNWGIHWENYYTVSNPIGALQISFFFLVCISNLSTNNTRIALQKTS